MIVLQLHIRDGRAVFSADRATPEALLEAVEAVVWDPVDLAERADGTVTATWANALMFLSDVRGRTFKRGIFLDESVLSLAASFRVAARLLAEGRVLPGLEETSEGWRAVWRPLPGDDPAERAVPEALVDALARRAGRTVLEEDRARHETVHDAWLAALRSDSGRLRWADAEAAAAFARQLASWRAPLRVSDADRAALRFCLIPPETETAAWQVTVAGVPVTRMGLVSLGQAVSVCPCLGGLRRTADGLAVALSRGEAEVFVRTGAPALSAAGYAVAVPPDLFGEHITVQADLDGGADPGKRRTVSASLTIRVAGEKVTEGELAFLLDQGSSLVFFRNRWIEVDRAVLREALRALQAAKKKTVSVREAVSFAVGVGRMGRLRVDEIRAHGWLRGLLNELKGEERFALLPPPPGLRAELRDYQVRGYSWLAFLAKWGFGPCLADDMGLGKTVQTIAFLLHLRQTAGVPRPALVVAPVSVTTNWMRELARFAPGLKTMLHQGRERLRGFAFSKACSRVDVVVTGYALLVKDFKDFSGVRFSALVLDEAQTVKNADTQAARAARALDVPVKAALTGTPLENSADDLWAIEACLNPGLLGERRDFSERFTRSIRTDARGGAAARLRHILAPFMLRRLKSDPRIAAELGAKREIRAYCPLSADQRRRYEDALTAYRTDVSAAAGEPSRGRMLALLTELKLICDGDGKLARLDALLTDLFAAGESCLIFTQYAKIGRLIQAHLRETFGRTFPFLHGGLPPTAREKEIAAFNEDPQPNAFILSLKAGGFGLNLTRATHVIHFDRWWNPAVENQATDRAYRIGQTKTVFVHTFICAGTLEDHIDELLEAKRNLAAEVVSGGESFLLSMNARAFEKAVALDAPPEGGTA